MAGTSAARWIWDVLHIRLSLYWLIDIGDRNLDGFEAALRLQFFRRQDSMYNYVRLMMF
jgi:hypothetical protein